MASSGWEGIPVHRPFLLLAYCSRSCTLKCLVRVQKLYDCTVGLATAFGLAYRSLFLHCEHAGPIFGFGRLGQMS